MHTKAKDVLYATRFSPEQAKLVLAFAEQYGMSVAAVLRLATLNLVSTIEVQKVLQKK